jgi:hypothetical protein
LSYFLFGKLICCKTKENTNEKINVIINEMLEKENISAKNKSRSPKPKTSFSFKLSLNFEYTLTTINKNRIKLKLIIQEVKNSSVSVDLKCKTPQQTPTKGNKNQYT